jgi:hypothetical protein
LSAVEKVQLKKSSFQLVLQKFGRIVEMTVESDGEEMARKELGGARRLYV